MQLKHRLISVQKSERQICCPANSCLTYMNFDVLSVLYYSSLPMLCMGYDVLTCQAIPVEEQYA